MAEPFGSRPGGAEDPSPEPIRHGVPAPRPPIGSDRGGPSRQVGIAVGHEEPRTTPPLHASPCMCGRARRAGCVAAHARGGRRGRGSGRVARDRSVSTACAWPFSSLCVWIDAASRRVASEGPGAGSRPGGTRNRAHGRVLCTDDRRQHPPRLATERSSAAPILLVIHAARARPPSSSRCASCLVRHQASGALFGRPRQARCSPLLPRAGAGSEPKKHVEKQRPEDPVLPLCLPNARGLKLAAGVPSLS